MLSLLVAACWTLSRLTAAQEQFFWSYKAENTTGSYEPYFEICGSSCEDCNPDAKACFAENWANLCFEPKAGETCCKDQFGTSCYDGYYCAYDEDNVAFCCAEDDEEEDCAKALNISLKDSHDPKKETPTASVTAIFTPAITASGQSVVPHPERTHAPPLPGSSKEKGEPDDLDVDRDMSMPVKVAIAIGVFVAVAILITLGIMCIIHRRKVARYSMLEKQNATPYPSNAHQGHHAMAAVPGIPPAASPYEPMRGQVSHHLRDSWTVSPAISRDASPHHSPRPSYMDRPFPASPQHHAIELTHVPPLQSPGLDSPGHKR